MRSGVADCEFADDELQIATQSAETTHHEYLPNLCVRYTFFSLFHRINIFFTLSPLILPSLTWLIEISPHSRQSSQCFSILLNLSQIIKNNQFQFSHFLHSLFSLLSSLSLRQRVFLVHLPHFRFIQKLSHHSSFFHHLSRLSFVGYFPRDQKLTLTFCIHLPFLCSPPFPRFCRN
jgi:hypothetical protein